MKWKPVLWLPPFITGAGALTGALISAHIYRVRRRSIIFPSKITESKHTAAQNRSFHHHAHETPNQHEHEFQNQHQHETPNSDIPAFSGCTAYKALRILHISDTHLTHRQNKRQHFLSSLAAQQPDLIVFTGDLIAEDAAIEPLLEALSAFRGIPGVFVYGSNDYFASAPRNPFKYFFKASALSKKTPPRRLDTPRLTAGLEELGFLNLNNRTAKIPLANWEIELVGVNDPHIGYAKFPSLKSLHSTAPQNDNANTTNTANRIRIGLTHAPYRKILNQMQEAGCNLVFAGHTHGGQICLPGNRALVTNCDLPPRYASGLFTWPISDCKDNTEDNEFVTDKNFPIRKNGIAVGRLSNTGGAKPEASGALTSSQDQHAAAPRKMFVQVSAGIGTSPFTQMRTFCPPEAIQIDIICI